MTNLFQTKCCLRKEYPSMKSTPDEKIFQFESPNHHSGFLLWQVSNLWQRKMKDGLSHLGLTHVQFVLLAGIAWLNREDNPVTQARLSAHAKTDVMMTSKVLRTLEQKGLVKRETHATDTRAKSLMMTDEGYQILVEAIQIVGQIDNDFFQNIGQQISGFNLCIECLIEANK